MVYLDFFVLDSSKNNSFASC